MLFFSINFIKIVHYMPFFIEFAFFLNIFLDKSFKENVSLIFGSIYYESIKGEENNGSRVFR